MKYEPKPAFKDRIRELLIDEKDYDKFFEISKFEPRKSIRVNTLKISVDELVKILKKKGWKFRQLDGNEEIIIIESELKPGELGNCREHMLGYYYIQEVTSMMPIIALNPKSGEIILDLCAAPGSKTTQIASMMKNKGTIIANDVSIGRMRILITNLERIGVTNSIVVRHDGLALCKRFKKLGMKFDKILVDAPCSGEGGLRCDNRVLLEWSEKMVESMGRKQKILLEAAIDILKEEGELIYSTCTYSPEENESVVQSILDEYNMEIVNVKLPLVTRNGITKWRKENYSDKMKKAVRIYHHDNDMEGFFLCKMRKKNESI
jgi:NOL1/NOP2/sun family putative RNA methylase